MLSQLCLRLMQLLLLVFPVLGWGATYTAYNTYLYPPFVNADGGGLAAGLVAALNRHMGGDRFVLMNVPRARFLAMASEDVQEFDGVALFLVPEFVDRLLPQGRYNWSQPVFEDSNVLVFRPAQPPAGPLPAALKGWRFGAVRGNTYLYVEPLIQSGDVVRDDGADELGNLRKLHAGRIDFTQMNHLYYRSLIAETPALNGLIAVREPDSLFQRRILLSQRLPDGVKTRLAYALAQLQRDNAWREVLVRHGLLLPAENALKRPVGVRVQPERYGKGFVLAHGRVTRKAPD